MERREFLKGLVAAGVGVSAPLVLVGKVHSTTIDDVINSLHTIIVRRTYTVNMEKLAEEYKQHYDSFILYQLRFRGISADSTVSSENEKKIQEDFNKLYKGEMLVPSGQDLKTIERFLVSYYSTFGVDLTKPIQYPMAKVGSAVVLQGKGTRRLMLTANHVYEAARNGFDGRMGTLLSVPLANIIGLPIASMEYKLILSSKTEEIYLGEPVKQNNSLDYALFELPPGVMLKPFQGKFLDYKNAHNGDQIFVLGVPSIYDSVMVRRGIIASLNARSVEESQHKVEPINDRVALDVKVYEGDSGGIFVNNTLHLGGLLVSYNNLTPTISFAVRIDAILKDGLKDFIHPRYYSK